MSKWLACLSFLLLPGFLSAQKYSISGYIKDADTGESLIGATVLQVGTSSGTTANAGAGTQQYRKWIGYSGCQKQIYLCAERLGIIGFL
ncbi:MAG: hypothetical protein ACOYXA_00605 [Bacteroidota bacterium]